MNIITKISIALNLIALLIIIIAFPKSTPITLSKKAFFETFGSPHIVEGNHVYYLGPWDPEGTLHKFRFDGDTMIQAESHYYDDVTPYISKLIESLRSDDEGTVAGAREFLITVFRLEWPNGYGAGYMADGPYKGTPFEKGKYPHAGYDEWKQWWEREGEDAFTPHH